MKKQIFAGLVALLALSFAACQMGPTGSDEDNGPAVSILEDENGFPAQVTIRIDGHEGKSVVSGSARALSKPIAQEVYDTYEVVFQAGATPTTVRASWKFRETVSISGVPRGSAPTGINYATPGGSAPSAAVGNAVLFVGRDTTEGPTLLAIGKIIAVDGTSGTTVLPSSKSVTFGLSALQGSAINPSGSFKGWTGYDSANPVTLSNGYTVTVYEFDEDTACDATYELGSSAGTAFTISQMLTGVVLDTTIDIPPLFGSLVTREPKLNDIPLTNYFGPITDGTATFDAILTLATGVITMRFTTTNHKGAVALFFNIPVNAINKLGTAPKTWFIRPGIDIGNIEVGASSTGAGILISNGEPSPSDDGLKIIVN